MLKDKRSQRHYLDILELLTLHQHPFTLDFLVMRKINFSECEQCLTQEFLFGTNAFDSHQLNLSPQRDSLFFSPTT